MFEINIDEAGFERALAYFSNLNGRVPRELNKILKDSAEPLEQEISRTTKRSSKNSMPHAKDDVTTNDRVSTIDGVPSVKVGFSTSTSWRMRFVNNGTKYQSDQRIIERSMASKQNEVYNIQKKGVSEMIERRGVSF